MYNPKHFAEDRPDVIRAFIENVSGAHLVSHTDSGLFCTQLPLLLDPDAGEHGSLIGHVARANPHWKLMGGESAGAASESMAIFAGPQGYVSPSFYASKAEHGKVVPTWNYSAVHVYGHLVARDDPAWTLDLVTRLSDHFESRRPQPWAVTDAPGDFIAGQVKAIVGIELQITRIEAKKKLSQNRSEQDLAGVIAGLNAGTAAEQALADTMG